MADVWITYGFADPKLRQMTCSAGHARGVARKGRDGMVTYDLDEERQPEGVRIRHLKGAMLRAPGPQDRGGGTAMTCGVFTADGERVTEAETWTSAGILSLASAPPNPDKARRRAGRWLFAGMAFNHFGHAFCYSLARFWAIERLRAAGVTLDGVILFQRKTDDGAGQSLFGRRLEAVLEVFAPGLPIVTLAEDEIVEELFVPTQGISTQPHMFAGIPEHHAFMRSHARKNAPVPDLDIYVSRGKTGPSKGNHILEMVIERGMEEAGYLIYYPELHSLSDQIATYARARRLVGVDGSAFHVAATALDPSARVALIARRAYFAGALARQITAFSGAFATEIRAYSEVYLHEQGIGKPDLWYKTLVLTDFDKLGEGLIAHGFLEKPPGWRLPARARIDSRLGRWGARLKTRFVRVPDEMLRTEPGAEGDGG